MKTFRGFLEEADHPRMVHVEPSRPGFFVVKKIGKAVKHVKPNDEVTSSDLDDLQNIGHRVREVHKKKKTVKEDVALDETKHVIVHHDLVTGKKAPCETYKGGICYDHYNSKAAAHAEAHFHNKMAKENGWQSRYSVAPASAFKGLKPVGRSGDDDRHPSHYRDSETTEKHAKGRRARLYHLGKDKVSEDVELLEAPSSDDKLKEKLSGAGYNQKDDSAGYHLYTHKTGGLSHSEMHDHLTSAGYRHFKTYKTKGNGMEHHTHTYLKSDRKGDHTAWFGTAKATDKIKYVSSSHHYMNEEHELVEERKYRVILSHHHVKDAPDSERAKIRIPVTIHGSSKEDAMQAAEKAYHDLNHSFMTRKHWVTKAHSAEEIKEEVEDLLEKDLRAEDRFKKGDKVSVGDNEIHTVTDVEHPMVYTDLRPKSDRNPGFHHTKVYKF